MQKGLADQEGLGTDWVAGLRVEGQKDGRRKGGNREEHGRREGGIEKKGRTKEVQGRNNGELE